MKITTLFAITYILTNFSISIAEIKPEHPRLYLTDSRMFSLSEKAKANTDQWIRLKNFVDGNYYSPTNQYILANALVYKIKKSNGDLDADVYKNAALKKMWSVIEYGTVSGNDGYKITDSSKNWIEETSKWEWDTLGSKRYYGINPNIKQNKLFRTNVGYGSDSNYTGYCVSTTCSGHTDTEIYVHPSPTSSLNQPMFSARSDLSAAASPGDTYVIFPTNPDFTKDRVLGVALAFDWLHDSFTSEQKNIIVAWLYGTGKYMMLENDYGPNKFRWSNYTIDYLSDLTAIAYAIYGWDSTKANEILSWVDEVYNNGVKNSFQWILQGGGWSEGDGYGAGILSRFTEFLEHGYTAEKLDRWSDFSEQLKSRLLYTMHMTLPTIKTGTGGIQYREVIANGDGERAKETTYDYVRKSCLMIIDHYPNEKISKTIQTFLSDTTNRNIFPFTAAWEFMFYNENQETLPLTYAPLQNAAINAGMIQMRSGWGSNATQATFKCGPKLAYHSHLDNTAFTIYKYQDLAPDTGTYPGSGGTTHGNNYFIRTIAHNAILLFDKNENSWTGSMQGNSGTFSNDGGQRNVRTWNPDGSLKSTGSWQTTGYNTGGYPYVGHEEIYKMGYISKYDYGDNYVYSVGDATSGYIGNTNKAKKVIRKFFYLRPDIFIVYDNVSVKDNSIISKYVLHSVDALTANGTGKEIVYNAEYKYTDADIIQIDNGNGRLFNKILLPLSPVIEKIGGRGLRDFWVNGINYPPGSNPYGTWRAEITAPSPLADTEFLNVLYATSTSTNLMPPTTLITSTDNQMKGVRLDNSSGIYVILFSNNDDTIPQNDITYFVPQGLSNHIIVDLAPETPYYVSILNGIATLTKTQPSNTHKVFTSSSAGSINFSVSVDGEVFTTSAPKIMKIQIQ